MDKNNEPSTFIAFDFGTRNIGVAVGQTVTKTATPLTPLLAQRGIPNWSEIAKLIKEWKPAALIVGVPYTLDDDALKVTPLALAFIEQLKERYALPVYPAEERLTTKSARAEVFAHGGYKALQKQSIDSVAAKIILEEWLWDPGIKY